MSDGTADIHASLEEVEERILQLLHEVGRVRPEALRPLPRKDAETYLARYAMRHPHDAYLLSDRSLVRAGMFVPETASPSAPPAGDAAGGARPSSTPRDARRTSAHRAANSNQEPAAPTAARLPGKPRLAFMPPAHDDLPDDETQTSVRWKQLAALISLVVFVLAICCLSVYLIAGPPPDRLLAFLNRPTATSAPGAGFTATATRAATRTAAATVTATAPPPAATPTEAGLGGSTVGKTVTLDIRNLSPGDNWSTCAAVDDQFGNPAGQACMSLAAAYADAEGQPLAVDNILAAIAVWVRLDASADGSSELISIASDPDSNLLPAGAWTLGQPGLRFDVTAGDLSAAITIAEIVTAPFPSAPNTAPFLKALTVDVGPR